MAREAKPPSIQALKGDGPHNLAAELDARLPAAQRALLRAVVDEAQDGELYLVGGPVRDLLLGLASLDFDLVLVGDAIRLARRLQKRYGGKAVQHKRFGTAAWELRGVRNEIAAQLGEELKAADLPESVDLITARSESYAKVGALPEVEFAGIGEDTGRRDFTINTLALRLDEDHYGELLDLWGGLEDLAAGRVKVLHDRSFADDPTRMLRIVRFATRLGMQIDAHTLDLLKEDRAYLAQVSGERIRNELDFTFTEDACAAIFQRMRELGLLEAIHPQLVFGEAAARALADPAGATPDPDWELSGVSHPQIGYVLWLVQLEPEAALQVAERLRLENELVRAVGAAAEFRARLGELAKKTASEATMMLEKLPALARFALYVSAEKKEMRGIFEQYAKEWRYIHPKTDGHDLESMGLKPGPRYGEILDALRAAWVNGDVRDEVGERELLKELLDESD